MSHDYDLAKAVIQQAIMESPIANEHLRCIYNKRGEKVNHELETLQLSRKDQVFGQQTGNDPSLGPVTLAPQRQKSAIYCLLEMRNGGGDG